MIPMLLLEATYVGTAFALVRLALTIPGVIAIGLLMERLLTGPQRIYKAYPVREEMQFAANSSETQ